MLSWASTCSSTIGAVAAACIRQRRVQAQRGGREELPCRAVTCGTPRQFHVRMHAAGRGLREARAGAHGLRMLLWRPGCPGDGKRAEPLFLLSWRLVAPHGALHRASSRVAAPAQLVSSRPHPHTTRAEAIRAERDVHLAPRGGMLRRHKQRTLRVWFYVQSRQEAGMARTRCARHKFPWLRAPRRRRSQQQLRSAFSSRALRAPQPWPPGPRRTGGAGARRSGAARRWRRG